MREYFEEIPSLDLAQFTKGDPEERQRFVNELGRAYTEIGFVAIKNHALTDEVQEKLYQAAENFFALPDEVKQKYEDPALQGQRGYIGKLKEHAKGRSTPDLKEFYHLGQSILPGDHITADYPQNIFPEEVPGLKKYGLAAYNALQETGISMLQAIALFLGIDEHFFDERVRKGNSILRPIHYFPVEDPTLFPAGAVRAAEHTDINLITLLMGASAEGRQVLRKDGRWIPITALPEQLVVNVGDMLSRLTNNTLKSTVHRVVNPPGDKMREPRYSIPFFMHPVSSMDLSCLPECISEVNPKQFPDITAGEYLQQRLKEIGF
ncbi:MAG: 2-oxoglutarate and iron-dependent oxygenase domain-containing protein [bacterium]